VAFQIRDGVTAWIRDVRSGAISAVRARYLVGADGANSLVRDSLGIAMRGEAGLSAELNVLFEAELGPVLGGRRFCMYRITGERAGGVLRPAGRPGRWLFGTAGEAGTSHERLVDMIRRAVGDPKLAVEIVASGAWEASARVAEAFRCGPVVLIGDAAHQHTPGGGFGMNAAIQGAHNLAWKLAAVLEHDAGDALLDTYETERRPVAELTVGLSVPMLRARGRTSGRTLGVVLGAHYEQGALIPDGTAPPRTGDPIGDYAPSARPGHRAPHLWLDETRSRSTLDLFGKGLVLLSPSPERWEASVDANLDPGISVRVRRLPRAEGARVYDVEHSGAVLVRPDGYVAARWCTAPEAAGTALQDAVVEVLCRSAAASASTRRSS
ncbi:MAG: FAD-dependent monooxygenase, partial [Solirubrobacterales bacterium]|nr:FAD-dependent monooxygenase [Solirubrobacterales bacterium]